jgi:hypothetical protein
MDGIPKFVNNGQITPDFYAVNTMQPPYQPSNNPPAKDGDKRFADHAFVLFLSEHSAYALLAGPGGRVFHTSDAPLVDALVAKLQNLYDLQPL